MTLLKALIALVPVCMMLSGSVVLFCRGKNVSSLLQLIGTSFLVVVVLAHVAEALNILPWVQWGHEHSIGHYLDLSGAVLGMTFFPVGYLIHTLTGRHT